MGRKHFGEILGENAGYQQFLLSPKMFSEAFLFKGHLNFGTVL